MDWLLILVNIIAIAILFFSFIGGIKDGAVKSGVSLIVLIVAIAVAGAFYHVLAGILSFLPGENWENFMGFFISFVIITAILHAILFIPRKMVERVVGKGALMRLIGGVLNIISSSIGLALLTVVFLAYPLFGFLEEAVIGSVVLTTLASVFGFVMALLPEAIRSNAMMVIDVVNIYLPV